MLYVNMKDHTVIRVDEFPLSAKDGWIPIQDPIVLTEKFLDLNQEVGEVLVKTNRGLLTRDEAFDRVIELVITMTTWVATPRD